MNTQNTIKKRSKWRYGAWVILAIGLLIAGVVQFWEYLPYNQTAAKQISNTLKSYGLSVESLEVTKLNQSEIILNNIQLSNNPGLKIAHINASYALEGFKNLIVHEVETNGIEAALYLKDGKWWIYGLEPLIQPESDSSELSILFQAEELRKLLPKTLQAKEISLSGKDADWAFDTQLSATLTTEPTLELNVVSPKLNAQSGEYQIVLDEVHGNAKFDNKKKQWNTKITAKNLDVSGLDTPIPPMQLTSDITITSENLLAKVKANNSKNTYLANADISLPTKNPRNGTIAIKKLHFPWGGGVIALNPVSIPLSFSKPIKLSIQLKKVKLAELLATLGEGKINGTGEISGVLPITYYPDGRVTLQKGKAEAIEAGTISVSPSLLPGDSEQLQVARTTLENFHYTTLKISVSSDKEEKSTIHLTLEGNNPDAFEGRPVKLNVNLAGDVLPLIQQSILPLNNLKQLLQLQDKP